MGRMDITGGGGGDETPLVFSASFLMESCPSLQEPFPSSRRGWQTVLLPMLMAQRRAGRQHSSGGGGSQRLCDRAGITRHGEAKGGQGGGAEAVEVNVIPQPFPSGLFEPSLVTEAAEGVILSLTSQ